ncbi:MAG: hypothetical protein OEY52_15445 [Gammaproteobacteria bacterium]|nr:hypothetical protein [Gammaproteobacteria bacterium]
MKKYFLCTQFYIPTYMLVLIIFMLSSCGGGGSGGTSSTNNDASFTVGGNVSGLNGSGLVLQNNGGDDLPINQNGGFKFLTPLQNDKGYKVTIKTQPDTVGHTCVVKNDSGTISGSDVTNIQVNCITYSDVTSCNNGSVKYAHNYTTDISGINQEIKVNGTVAFVCDLDGNITGSDTLLIEITGVAALGDFTCLWVSVGDLEVVLSGVLLDGTLSIDFKEIWYADEAEGIQTCTNSEGKTYTGIFPYVAVELNHSIDFPAVDGFVTDSPAIGPGAKGNYQWILGLE